MSSAVSASAKALATKEANRALVEELLPLPFSEQADRITALRPATRIRQVGIQLAKALLINADYTSKSVPEREAFRISLPPFHRHYIQLVLKEGIPSSSATKKKSRSPSTAAAAAVSNSDNNSPRAAAEGEPSELDKRIEKFRREGIPFSFLYEFTKNTQDREATQNYGKYTIEARKNSTDEAFIKKLMDIETLEDSPAQVFIVKMIHNIFQEHINRYITKTEGVLKEDDMTFKIAIEGIKENLGAIAVNVDLTDLDDDVPLIKYMTADEFHKLAILFVKSEYSTDANKPTIMAPLFKFLGSILRRFELFKQQKNHKKTRKLQYGLRSKSASANINAAEKVFLTKQMTILGKQDLTLAQKQNALRVLGNERKTYFAPVPFTTPLLDFKGFKQHATECSTDTISQIILQGVPWAALIQERLYNGTIAEFNAMYDRTLACPGIHPSREDMIALILNMQERFKLHYTAAKKTEEAITCIQPYNYNKIGPILTRKARKSAELGPSVKRNVKTLTKARESTSSAYVTYILQLLFRFFGFNNILCYKRTVTYIYRKNPILYTYDDIQYKGFKHLAFAFRINHYRPKDITLFTRPYQDVIGHYSALYKSLNGSWNYYDNEVGVLPIDKMLIGALLNERTHTWFIGFVYTRMEGNSNNSVTFYKIPYFNLSNIDELNNKKIEQWNDGEWIEIDFREIATVSRISTIDDITHIVSKTTEEPGYNGLFMDDA